MLYAAQEGHSGAILSMLICGGNPARQGSDWAEFLMAAMSTFRPHMAETIFSLTTLSQLGPVSQTAVCTRHFCPPGPALQACTATIPSQICSAWGCLLHAMPASQYMKHCPKDEALSVLCRIWSKQH